MVGALFVVESVAFLVVMGWARWRIRSLVNLGRAMRSDLAATRDRSMKAERELALVGKSPAADSPSPTRKPYRGRLVTADEVVEVRAMLSAGMSVGEVMERTGRSHGVVYSIKSGHYDRLLSDGKGAAGGAS
jgi:hypothetical protein